MWTKEVFLSTFRFIEQPSSRHTNQTMIKITFSNKKITSLNRKGKHHTRQSFQPSYIIEFSLLKKMGITRWNQMPIVPFSILATSQIIPPRLVSWSHQQGTTRAGSTQVTTILHLDGNIYLIDFLVGTREPQY